MASARSVIVRFTSNSTSTAAPAAARLASLRQRVLQARSGVRKNQPHRKTTGARGAIARYFGLRGAAAATAPYGLGDDDRDATW